MKTKNLFLTTILLSVALGISGCSDFLDEVPLSQSTQSNAYKTAADAEAALAGAYESYQGDFYVWENVLYNDVRSDNHYAGGDNPNIFEIDELRISIYSTRVQGTWSSLFNGIAKANLVIAKVPGIDDANLDNGNRRAQIIGEATFLRGEKYFQLVKLFGGVPLILEPVESTDPSVTNVERATVEDVYSQVIADMEFALERLPSKYSDDASMNKARATKGAANAFLAKAYAQKPVPEYDKVLQYCDAVINDTEAGYDLMDNYDELFDGAHYNNKESIMEIQYLGGTEGNWGPQMMLPPSLSGDGWRKFITPSHNLVDAFDAAGDSVRKQATIFWENVGWTDEYWAVGGGNVPFGYKWRSASGWASSNRQYLVRLADIILLKAEALNELNRTPEAIIELNKIRNRALLNNTTATTKDQVRNAILSERRLEFAQEGQRWDDLVRFGKAVDVMNNLVETNLVTGARVNYGMNTDKLLLPIPQEERERNTKLTQNPGYTQ